MVSAKRLRSTAKFNAWRTCLLSSGRLGYVQKHHKRDAVWVVNQHLEVGVRLPARAVADGWIHHGVERPGVELDVHGLRVFGDRDVDTVEVGLAACQ